MANTHLKHIFILVFLLSVSCIAQTQSCNCTIAQVQQNTVEPCSLVIGTVDTVGSVSEFWNALNQANAAGGNRTILIKNGDYQVASTSSYPYITGDNIVFRSLSGKRDSVILRGGGMFSSNQTENGFGVAGNYVTIADLTIKDVGNHGIQVSGHHLTVHNVRIQDTYEQMIKGSTSGTSIDSAVVQCSLFEYTAGIGPNWYIGGLDIHKGKHWLVNDNIFKDITSPNNAAAEHAVHFWDQSIENIVERNRIINCDRGIGFGLGTNGNQNTGGIIRNNMIYNNGAGLYDDVGIGLESSPHSQVYNNTVWIDYFNAIEYRFSTTVNAVIQNNLTNTAIASRNGASGTLSTNLTNAASNWFVDITAGDFQLVSNVSSVVDQGTDLGMLVPNDINQTSRPLGLGYDIGAYEAGFFDVILYTDCIELLNQADADNFTISGQLNLYTIDIVNSNGSVIENVNPSGSSVSIDLTNLPPGLLFIRLTHISNSEISLIKIISQ